MDEVERYRERRRRLIEHLGRPHVFWPAMVGGSVLVNGPSGPWPSVWLWALTAMVLGPGLAAVLWWRQGRSARRSPAG